MSDVPKVRPYKLGERECATLAELASAMNEDPEGAQEHLSRGYIQKWLEDDLREYDARIALDQLLQKGVAYAIFEFLLRYAPEDTPRIEGLPVSEKWLGEYLPQLLKDDRIASFTGIHLLAHRLRRWNLLTDKRVTRGSERLAKIDEIWRRETAIAAKARGEMLLYQGLYNAQGEALEQELWDNRAVELAFARAHAGSSEQSPGDLESALDAVASPEQTELLIELWVNYETSKPFETRYKVEDGLYFKEAMKRAWFANMMNSDAERTPGREAALRRAAKLAFEQEMDRQNLEEARQQEQTDAPPEGKFIGGWLSTLDRRVQAAIFAIPVFVTTFYFHEWDSGGGWVFATYLAIGLTIGLAPFRALPIKPKYWWAEGLAGYSIGMVLVTAYAMEFTYATFEPQLVFAALAGLAGYFRNPMLVYRKKQLGKSEERAREAQNPNDARRISIDALETMFFPERVFNMAYAEMSPGQQRFYHRAREGLPDDTGLSRYADRRSPVAPNHGDGSSVGFAGFNVASDGTNTVHVMDGVSMDGEGNWNLRVVDGVTLHSDGKTTTRVADGLDIRSDGQVSAEIGGFRLSSGGKEKKKDEWDWGTGEKKEKGWFD